MTPNPGGSLRRPSDLAREIGRAERGRPERPSPGEAPKPARDPGGHLDWPRGFASTSEDRDALLVLSSLASVTPRRLLQLAQDHPTARACLVQVANGEVGSDRDRALAGRLEARDVSRRLEAAGARVVPVHDPEYPPELLDLFDPPAALYLVGGPVADLVPRVAVVGARNCSASGKEMAGLLGRRLAGAGVCVVSGGARGIDTAAHRGSLDGGGPTVVVLGCGIDVAYPRQNARLLREAASAGAVVSEYPPGVPAEPFRFPARNRLVAGLAVAVVVVEGAAGSGSMITADHALDLGREVFAVPGMVTSPLAQVPLALIRDGATLVRGPDDLLHDLGIDPRRSAADPAGPAGDGLPEVEGAVWASLSGPSTADGLAAAAGLPLPRVMSALVALEMRGLVRQTGGRYERLITGESAAEMPAGRGRSRAKPMVDR